MTRTRVNRERTVAHRGDERDVVYIEREGGSSLKWLVIGVALGGALALLFAPKSGEDTRRALARRLRGIRRAAEDKISDIGGDPELLQTVRGFGYVLARDGA